MAGGIFAASIPCIKCIEEAVRTYEGMENDAYQCKSCGFAFSVDWSHGTLPQKACWPLSEEEAEEARKISAIINQQS
jgi:hypothetical protein